MFRSFRNSPKVRLAVRAIVVAVIAYGVKVFGAGVEAFSLVPFLWGLGSAGVYALVGVFTPVEPNVGVKARVKVPAENNTLTH